MADARNHEGVGIARSDGFGDQTHGGARRGQSLHDGRQIAGAVVDHATVIANFYWLRVGPHPHALPSPRLEDSLGPATSHSSPFVLGSIVFSRLSFAQATRSARANALKIASIW